MKGMNLAAVCVFVILWVLLTVHPKDDHNKAFDERYINTITEYNNHRYEAYNGPKTVLEEADAPYTCEYTEHDKYLFVLEGMREAGVKEVDAIHAVMQVIRNRQKSEDYPDTVEGVIYQENQFALHDNGEPNWKCYQALENMLASPEAFPMDMYWFNSEHYPNYGYPYTVIDGMYFSTVTDYNTVEVEE